VSNSKVRAIAAWFPRVVGDDRRGRHQPTRTALDHRLPARRPRDLAVVLEAALQRDQPVAPPDLAIVRRALKHTGIIRTLTSPSITVSTISSSPAQAKMMTWRPIWPSSA
jgi:hypothetical protein